MSVKNDVVNMIIDVNGSAAKKEFYALNAEAAKVRAEMSKLKKGTEEWIAKSKELETIEIQIAKVRKELNFTDLTMKQLRKEIAKMKTARADIDPTSQAFKDMTLQIDKAEAQMRNLNQGGTFLSRTFNFLKKEALGFGVVMLGALGIDYVIGKIGNLIQRNSELSDSYANIRKVTGFTAEETKKLTTDLGKIDTRTPRKELLLLAEEAGRLGIEGVENVRGFVEEANKIKVALGDDLTDEAIREVGKLTTVYKVGEQTGKDFAGSMNALGSSINLVSASGSSQAEFLVDYLKRQAGIAAQTKLSASNNVAYAASFDELGQSVEVSATAMNKVWMDLYTNTDKYAKIAGISTEKFKGILDKDANQAMLLFLDGLNQTNGGFEIMLELLGDLEVGGARGAQAILALASNTERLKTIQADSNKAIIEATSLNNEYALKNENLAAKVEKLQKRFAALFVSDKLNNWVENGVDKVNSLMDSFSSLAKWIERNWFLIKSIIVAYGTYLIATGRIIAVKTIELALDSARNTLLFSMLKIEQAYVLLKKVLTTELTLAAAAQRIFNSAVSANPMAFITTLIVGATVALKGYIENIKEAQIEQKRLLSANLSEFNVKFANSQTEAVIKKSNEILAKGSREQIEAETKRLNDYLAKNAKTIADKKAEMDKARQEFESSLKEYKNDLGGTQKTSKNADDKKTDLLNLNGKTESYNAYVQSSNAIIKQRTLVSEKLKELDQKDSQSATELTDKQKAELAKRKTDYAKYLADLKKYKQELQDFYDKVEQSKIDVIDEELAKDIASLDLKKQIEERELERKINSMNAEAKRLNISQSEQDKIIEQSAFLKLQIEEKYQADKKALVDKYNAEIKKGNYDNELKAVNDYAASQKLLWSQLYRDQVIDKNTYDNELENLDLNAKAKLLDIAQRYGIDVKKATQDLTDAEIKIMADGVERKKALLKREANFRVELAEYNQKKDPSKSNLAEVYNAQIVQLGINLQNEIDLVKGGEEEKFQIYSEYNLKRQQLDDEFRANAAQQRQDEIVEKGNAAMQYASIANDFAQQIFDFRRQKFEEELNAAQNTYTKENAALDQQYKNHLVSDVEYNNKKKQIQEKLDKEQRALKRKQAINDKIAALFSIGLNTGQAIMSALAGPWPASIAFAALAGAMGAVQLGFAASKEIPQFYTGGYAGKKKVTGAQDGRTYDAKILPGFGQGYLSNPSLVLAGEHGEEYFVNNTMLKNPTVKYVVDGIDQLSKGNISYPDFQGMLAMPALQQRYTGGYVGQTNTAAPSINPKNDNNVLSYEVQLQILGFLGKLNTHLDKGIKADAHIGDKLIVDFKKRSTYLDSIVDDAN